MNESDQENACLQLSQRDAQKLGISRRTWENARAAAKQNRPVQPTKRGRPTDEILTAFILDRVKIEPHMSMQRLAYAAGCSYSKVQNVLKANSLSLQWQRMAWAGHEEPVKPDLVRARERYKAGGLQVDGPGALVHIDSKRFGALQGGVLCIGYVVIDNYSGFSTIHFATDSLKSGYNAVCALDWFRMQFPAPETILTIYSDNGSEFINVDVTRWVENNGYVHKQIKAGHSWSNGKVERANAMINAEVVRPLKVKQRFANLDELQMAVDLEMCWFNEERPWFGHTNKGLPPRLVAAATAGMEAEEREQTLAELRKNMRWLNRAQWEKHQSKVEDLRP